MGKSLSLDIRERVVSLVEDGHSCHEAARLSVENPMPKSDATCFRVSPLVSAILTASCRNSAVRFVPIESGAYIRPTLQSKVTACVYPHISTVIRDVLRALDFFMQRPHCRSGVRFREMG